MSVDPDHRREFTKNRLTWVMITGVVVFVVLAVVLTLGGE